MGKRKISRMHIFSCLVTMYAVKSTISIKLIYIPVIIPSLLVYVSLLIVRVSLASRFPK